MHHEPFTQSQQGERMASDFSKFRPNPNQLRWKPYPLPEPSDSRDFVQSLYTMCGAGDATMRNGIAIHNYACSAEMSKKCLYNSDGDFLIGGDGI